MRRTGIGLVLLPVVLATATGCATRGWVEDVVGKERVAVDRRVQTVESRLGDEGRRIGAVEGRVDDQDRQVQDLGVKVRTVEDGLATTSGVADAAQARAEAAYGRAAEVDVRLARLWSQRHERTALESLNVQFGFNRWDLDDRAQTALLAVVEELQRDPGLAVALEGYADPRGEREYNIRLSQRRVEAVRRYLVQRGVEQWRIHAIGLGPLAEAGTPNAEKRRVTVTLMGDAR
jgi:outer membrane protein OmpA-like peptidoglycan-associated protein